jgi:hypothetical protein
MRILGLDISTSVVGYTFLSGESSNSYEISQIGHMDFSKCNDIWEKVDKFAQLIQPEIIRFDPQIVYVEEALIGFSTGKSSAKTITTLVMFNAMCSFQIRSMMRGAPPKFIPSMTARKTCGIKIHQKSKCGLSGKEQTFNWARSGPLSSRTFETTRTGKFKPWNYDEVDSFVVALSGLTLETVRPCLDSCGSE